MLASGGARLKAFTTVRGGRASRLTRRAAPRSDPPQGGDDERTVWGDASKCDPGKLHTSMVSAVRRLADQFADVIATVDSARKSAEARRGAELSRLRDTLREAAASEMDVMARVVGRTSDVAEAEVVTEDGAGAVKKDGGEDPAWWLTPEEDDDSPSGGGSPQAGSSD